MGRSVNIYSTVKYTIEWINVSLRTNNYVDSTSTYSNINVKSDIVIDSLINISFSKINKVFYKIML